MKAFHEINSHKAGIVKTRFLAFFLMIISTFACENDIELIKSFSNDALIPSQSQVNVETVYTDAGKLQYRYSAREIHNYSNVKEKYLEFPYGVFAEFFDSNEEVESQFSSRYAIYYIDKELWEARDSVVVINREGEKLNTDHLFWDEKQKIIYSSSFVRVTRPNEEITGEGFEADETFSRWEIRKITGTISINDEQ